MDTPLPTNPGHRWQRHRAEQPTSPARLLRLGVQLAPRTVREAAVRMAVTAPAVAIGVSLLLSVLGLYHAYQATIARPCWQCTQQTATSQATLLWNFRLDYYQGQLIQRLDVATLCPAGCVTNAEGSLM